MSVAVPLEALREQIAAFGDHPYLITVGTDRRSHVVSETVRFDDKRVLVSAGHSSRANVADNPAVTLLWAALDGGDYSLILDAEAEAPDGDTGDIVVRPTRAVLHRVAGITGVPKCVPLEASD